MSFFKGEKYMTYNEVMALIMPSIIALLFYSKITNSNMTFLEITGILVLFMLVTNCICYSIIIYFKKIPSFDIAFTMKYSIMATFIALITATLYRFIELNINIKIKVEPTDEKE
jgi:hypothetical protein